MPLYLREMDWMMIPLQDEYVINSSFTKSKKSPDLVSRMASPLCRDLICITRKKFGVRV